MKPDFVICNYQISKWWEPKETPLFGSEGERARRLSENFQASRDLEALLIGMGFVPHRLGKEGRYDFYQNEDQGLLRNIDFEMTERRMVRRDVLERLWRFLRDLPHEYCIRVFNDFDDSIEIFRIAITKDKVFGQFETVEMAEAFGFHPKEEVGPIE